MHFSSNKYSNHITNFGKQKAKLCIPKPLKQPAIKHAFYFTFPFSLHFLSFGCHKHFPTLHLFFIMTIETIKTTP